MLKKWFPQMENFSGQLRKYKVTINDLLEENKKLKERARASESGKMKGRMEWALKSKLQTTIRSQCHITHKDEKYSVTLTLGRLHRKF